MRVQERSLAPAPLDSGAPVGQAAAVAGAHPGSPSTARPTRLAIAAVVVGAASIPIGFVLVLGWVLGLVAIVLGGLAVKRGASSRGPAFWGIWLGVAGTVVSMLVFALQVAGR